MCTCGSTINDIVPNKQSEQRLENNDVHTTRYNIGQDRPKEKPNGMPLGKEKKDTWFTSFP